MKRKLMGIVVFCFAATFLNAAQEDGKGALESFKKHLADVQAEWDGTVSEVKVVKGKKHQYDSIPEKLVRAKGNAQSILKKIEARQDELVKTKVPPELVSERDALLAQSRSLAEVLNSYIKQDVREATDKTLDDIRRSADDHIADSDRAWSPVAISLSSSIQWPRAEADIMGLGLNVFAGEYHNVYGVDIATIENVVSNCAAGIQLAGFGNVSDTAYGFQVALGNAANELVGGAQISLLLNKNECYGSWLQVGVGLNSSGFFEGAQVAGFGNSAYSCKGLQIGGLANRAEEMIGFQIVGLGNSAKELSGFQIGGLANHAEELFGFQIGVLGGNSAEKLFGFQIGANNLASELSGFQIGAFNSDAFYAGKKKVKLSGFQVSVINDAEELSGFQIGVDNDAKGLSGFQIGVECNEAEEGSGFQIGVVGNHVAKKLSGFQIGVGNYAKELSGFQVGALNIAKKKLSGLQIGVFNLAEQANGLQVGLLNYYGDTSCSPFFKLHF